MKHLIIVTGPTAIGKTDFCLSLAQKLNTEIISCDSRQIYRGLKIGTAQPTQEQKNLIKHHLIDCVNIYQLYTVADFVDDAKKKLNDLFKKYETVIMTGGTGLYINAFVYGLDQLPKIEKKIRDQVRDDFKNYGLDFCLEKLKTLDPECESFLDKKNPQRVLRALEVIVQTGHPLRFFYKKKKNTEDYKISIIGINMDRSTLYQRIDKRVDIMLEEGLLEEAKKFFEYRHYNSLQTIGYKEIFDFLEKKCSLDEAVADIKLNTRHYAKRQITWLKNKIPHLIWIDKEKLNDFVFE